MIKLCTYEEQRNADSVFFGKPHGKRQLGRRRRRWKDNTKMQLRDLGWDGTNWIEVAHERERLRDPMNKVMKLSVSSNYGAYLSR
jgi:hypothetical protein